MLLRRTPEKFHEEQRELAQITDDEIDDYRLRQRQRADAEAGAGAGYRRGLFRAWIALSAAWSSLWLLVALKAYWDWMEENPWVQHASTHCSPYLASCRFDYWMRGFAVILLPWLLTAVVMCARWVIRGFR
jgi:hypothetical protein